MATRNLTAKFVALRNSVRSSRPWNASSDPLLPPGSSASEQFVPAQPPAWIDVLESSQRDIAQIKENLRELSRLHNDRLTVTFEDEATIREKEQNIDIVAQSITSALKRCENSIKRIALVDITPGTYLTPQQRIARQNAMQAIGKELQEQSQQFRRAQKEFLNSLREQDQLSSEMFGVQDGSKVIDINTALDRGLTADQMEQLQEMNRASDERYKEVIRLAQSINELSTLFRELNVLVIEQGSVIDRIDYNIEQTKEKVLAGSVELQKADEHSRKAYTMKCIIVLILVIFILLIILIWKFSSGSNKSTTSS